MVDCDAVTAGRSPGRGVCSSLLRDPVRRSTLEALADGPPPVHLSRFATAVADGRAGPRRADALATKPHHTHLPQPDDAGLVESEPRTNTVESWHPERFPNRESDG